MYTYVIYGNPIPLARPRFSSSRIWDKQKHLKTNISIDLAQQHEDRPLFKSPIHVDIWFYMPIAASKTPSRKKTFQGKNHASKPDLDNMVKFYLDVSNGILFTDDAIVCSINAKKLYDNNPRTEFIITPL